MGIDINLLRPEKGGNPEAVKASQRKRGGDKAVALVDEVMTLDKEWISGATLPWHPGLTSGWVESDDSSSMQTARFEADEINKEINAIGKQIAPLAKAKKLDSPEAQALRQQKADLEAKKGQLKREADDKEKLLQTKLGLIGNMVHESCVDSRDEANNKIMSKWWPEGRSEAAEKERREKLVSKDGKGSPGLYAHNEVLERIGGYDPVRGTFLIGLG